MRPRPGVRRSAIPAGVRAGAAAVLAAGVVLGSGAAGVTVGAHAARTWARSTAGGPPPGGGAWPGLTGRQGAGYLGAMLDSGVGPPARCRPDARPGAERGGGRPPR
jgi:hypothetical protein